GLAYDYFYEAALMDLADLEHNVRDGVHMASLAGAWIAAVAGFGGMRDEDGELTFAPRVPPALSRLSFRLMFRDRLLEVVVNHTHADYRLLEGETLDIAHHGQPLRVEPGEGTSARIPEIPALPEPSQPPGREPARRSRES